MSWEYWTPEPEPEPEEVRPSVAKLVNRIADQKREIQKLLNELADARTESMRLRAALREAYEVYAGSDGFIPETAGEGYQQQIIRQMVNCISAALGGVNGY